MADVITRLRIETDEAQNRLRRFSSDVNSMSQQLEVAGNSLALMNENNLKLMKSFGDMQTVSTTLKGKISELSDAYLAAGHLYNTLSAEERNSPLGQYITEGMSKLKLRIEEVRKETNMLTSAMNEASVAAQKMSVVAGKFTGRGFMSAGDKAFNMVAGKYSYLNDIGNGSLQEQYNSTARAIMRLRTEYHNMTAEERAQPFGMAMSSVLTTLRTKLTALRAEVGTTGKAVVHASKEVQAAVAPMKGLSFGQHFMNHMIPGFSMGMGAMGAFAAVRVVTKAVGLMRDTVVSAVRENMEFEQSNANLAAILGKTTDQIYKLTENAKALGGSTIYTASQISELQTVLSRRGFGEDQILNMTHGIANLAVATGTDLAQSAELAASTMQAFGMRATDMERIVSVLGVSTTKSALTTQALGTSLQYVAPTARAAGFSLEDTVAMLGALVDAGIDASTAGTSLRQIILGMSTANGKLANSFGHPIRGLKDFVASIRKLKENGGASLDEISKKVRVTAVPAFLSLVENADRLEELRGSITGVEEELDQMAKKQMDTAKGASIILKSAWEGLKLTFAESNGTIKEWLEDITKLINAYKEHRQYLQGGQASVNASIGDNEAFRKKTQERAKEYIEQWNHDEAFLLMKGTRTYSEAGYDPWGIPYNYTIDHEGHNTVGEEATAELEKQKKLYEQLIPLSKQYADHAGGDTYGMGAYARVDFTKRNEAIAAIQKLMPEWKFSNPKELADKYLTPMFSDISMYEEILRQLSEEASNGGTLLDDPEDASDKTTGTVAIVERAKDVVAKALLRYEQELKELENRLGAGLIDQAEFDNSKVRLSENVWEAYGRADMLEPSEEWKKGMAKWEKAMGDDADIAAMSGGFDKLVKAEDKFQRALELAAMMEEQGLQDSIAIKRKMLSALESLWNTYAETATDLNDDDIAGEAKELAERIKGLRETIRKQEEEIAANKELVRIDRRTQQGIIGSYSKNEWTKIDPNGELRRRMGEFKVQLDGGVEIPDKDWQDFLTDLGERLAELKLPPIEVELSTGTVIKAEDRIKSLATAWGYVENAVSSVGSALETVGEMTEDPSAKIAGIIATAVASTALGFAQAATADSKFGTLAWIASAAAGLANMTAMIASIKSVTAEYHAEGGFIGGPRGTDVTPMWGTPGELVLNRAQQTNLAAQLAPANRTQGMAPSQPYVTGEVMWLGLQNYLQRTGRGEIVTTRR